MIDVITGGSGSGKSEYAEKIAVSRGGRLIYLATMQPFGAEARLRIERHKKLRDGKGFQTIEAFTARECCNVPEGATALLECMSNLVANEMFGTGGGYIDRVKKCISWLEKHCKHLIVVTNEIFSDGIQYDAETVNYIRAMSEINRFLFSAADSVTEVVYSIPVSIKGECLC